MNIEAEELLNMLRHAEVVGGYKVLNWLNFEFEENMTAKDIVDTVGYAMSILSEELYRHFNNDYLILTHLKDRIEKRMKKEGKAK